VTTPLLLFAVTEGAGRSSLPVGWAYWYDPVMVTYEQLRDQLAHRPFQKFRIIFSGGKALDVKRPNQVVAMKRRVYAGARKNLPTWIWLDQIERVELIEAQPA